MTTQRKVPATINDLVAELQTTEFGPKTKERIEYWLRTVYNEFRPKVEFQHPNHELARQAATSLNGLRVEIPEAKSAVSLHGYLSATTTGCHSIAISGLRVLTTQLTTPEQLDLLAKYSFPHIFRAVYKKFFTDPTRYLVSHVYISDNYHPSHDPVGRGLFDRAKHVAWGSKDKVPGLPPHTQLTRTKDFMEALKTYCQRDPKTYGRVAETGYVGNPVHGWQGKCKSIIWITPEAVAKGEVSQFDTGDSLWAEVRLAPVETAQTVVGDDVQK